MLKTLHIDKHILSATECAECAGQVRDWYDRVAIVVAAKPPDVVQQCLDLVRDQSETTGHSYRLEQLADRLKGKTDSIIQVYIVVSNSIIMVEYTLGGCLRHSVSQNCVYPFTSTLVV